MKNWKDIEKYENVYNVNQFGDVMNIITNKVLKPQLNTYGYPIVTLYKDGVGKIYLISRLVAKAFPEICGEWFDGCHVDHINTIRTDNRAVNLRVCTQLQNNNNPLTKQKISKSRTGIKFTEQHKRNISKSKSLPIVRLSKNNELIDVWDSIKQCSTTLEIHSSNIVQCCKGKRKTCGGFIFKYKD